MFFFNLRSLLASTLSYEEEPPFVCVEPFSMLLFHQGAISAVLYHLCLYKLRKGKKSPYILLFWNKTRSFVSKNKVAHNEYDVKCKLQIRADN